RQRVTDTPMYFNTSASMRWNVNGDWQDADPFAGGVRRADLYTVALHEFGHFIVLQDLNRLRPDLANLPWNRQAVMYWDGTRKASLTEDDKEGATMLHGPRTGWEEDQ